MTNGNDSVSPQVENTTSPNGDYSVKTNGGITKREYFAAMAMQGILAGRMDAIPSEIVLISAVEHADVLIEALNQE